MKKQILNLGKAVNKAEQKSINGGYVMYENNGGCAWNMCRNSFGRCTLFCD